MGEEIDIIIKVFEFANDLKYGESKQVDCPICGNKLIIQRSAYNGHIFAKCLSEKCIAIIQ